MIAKAGRGGLNFTYSIAYDSAVWTPTGTAGSQTWQPLETWGWTSDTNAITGYFTYNSINRKCYNDPDNPGSWVNSTIQSGFLYIDQNGQSHNFSNGTARNTNISDCSNYGSDSATIAATDGSGLVLYGQINAYQIKYPNGKLVTPPQNAYSGTASAVDSNGNKLTTSSTGIVDTTGTTVVSLSGSGTATSPRVLTYPTYGTSGASTATVTIHYASFNVLTAFGCSGVSEYSANSISLVDYVLLADNEKYQFAYETTPGHSGYTTGRLASILLPTGGHITYQYAGANNGIVCQDGGTATLTRSMPDDPAGASWTYTRTPGSGGAANSHTDVVDNASVHATYDFVNDTTDTFKTPYVVQHSQYSGNVTGTPLLAEATCYNSATTCLGQSLTLPVTQQVTTTTLDGSSVKKTSLTYSIYGLLTREDLYDWGNGSPGPELMGQAINYNTTLGNGIIDRPQNFCTYTSSSCDQFIQYNYDETTPVTTSGLPQHQSVSGSRGNLTSVKLTIGGGTTTIPQATYAYDDAGQVRTQKDLKSNATTYTYDTATGTFATQMSMPSTGSVTHTTSATYDAASGLMLKSFDQNNTETDYTYDSLLRNTAIKTISGTSTLSSSTAAYNLTATSPSVAQAVLHAGSSSMTATATLDPYGRALTVDSTDAPSDALVQYAYNAHGLLRQVSNPYRSGDTIHYTQYVYDALNRAKTVTDSDGASQATYAYSGNSTLVTDEASHQRKLFTDGVGRISQVMEPDSSNALSLETDYGYYQNPYQPSGSGTWTYQTVVTQKGGAALSSWRTRSFTYDMQGRLVSQQTPEAGTITYTYPNTAADCAGSIALPCTQTDANGTISTYSYDALNRLVGKSYGGSTIGTATAAVSYLYDQTSYNGLTIAFGKGQRTGMTDASGASAWSFDALGNTTAVRKTINGYTKQANYTYNADSSVNTVQDFGGTTLTYSYDVAAHPTQVSDGTNTYASGATYNAAGELTSMNHKLTSSGASYVRQWQYNTRLQPGVISATVNGTTVQSLTYGYGGGATNNGNILSIANGLDSTRSQTFTYDNLNRVYMGGDGHHWGESYGYDNWGNMTSKTVTVGSGTNFSVTASAQNRLSNLSYDTAGEVTQDQFGNAYIYDAEGRLKTAGSGSYVYDGDGQRVKKTVGSTVTLYWNGATGLLDESDATAATMAKQVHMAGLTLWSEIVGSGGRFLLHDHLGSVRLTGDPSGSIKDDYDYRPFGGVVADYGSAPTTNHYTFTGYESDQSESSTDYAVFRNLSTSMSRFNRPDPSDGSYDFTNPQSLNRYSYVLNSPLRLTDPMGLDLCDDFVCFVDDGGGGEGGGGGGCDPNYCVSVTADPDPPVDTGDDPDPGVDTSHLGLIPILPIPSYDPNNAITMVNGVYTLRVNASTTALPGAVPFCIAHPILCADAATAVTDILGPIIFFSPLILIEGDNRRKPDAATCRQIIQDAKKVCTEKYPAGPPDNRLGAWRLCVRQIVEPTGCDF